jgi:hypothetical protein
MIDLRLRIQIKNLATHRRRRSLRLTGFNPISGDESLWMSNNPVPTVISIKIAGPDNGSVVCAQSESCCWIFSTIKAQYLPSLDGMHPVSGNRQFGYFLHPNGHMEIYTKGADRLFFPQSPPFAITGGVEKITAYLMEKIAFFGADNLWESFQNGIKTFANNPLYSGAATINSPIKVRPKVKNELKSLLKQSGPLNYIPCGN